MKAFVLYNPLAGNRRHSDSMERLCAALKEEKVLCDMTRHEECEAKLSEMEEGDYIILCGGDGTLNHFINALGEREPPCPIYYYPCGSGNDFAHDLGHEFACAPFPITDHLRALPSVAVNGQKRLFLNGVGLGIDGYCCEESDRLRAKPGAVINYVAIALKGLFFHYRPANAVVTVDGVEHSYKKVWMATTMYGHFYGGGVSPIPSQQRSDPEGLLSVMVAHNAGKLRALLTVPSILKGKHTRLKNNVDVFRGEEITVRFDSPAAMQIDGETVLGVREYTARAARVREDRPLAAVCPGTP